MPGVTVIPEVLKQGYLVLHITLWKMVWPKELCTPLKMEVQNWPDCNWKKWNRHVYRCTTRKNAAVHNKRTDNRDADRRIFKGLFGSSPFATLSNKARVCQEGIPKRPGPLTVLIRLDSGYQWSMCPWKRTSGKSENRWEISDKCDQFVTSHRHYLQNLGRLTRSCNRNTHGLDTVSYLQCKRDPQDRKPPVYMNDYSCDI